MKGLEFLIQHLLPLSNHQTLEGNKHKRNKMLWASNKSTIRAKSIKFQITFKIEFKE